MRVTSLGVAVVLLGVAVGCQVEVIRPAPPPPPRQAYYPAPPPPPGAVVVRRPTVRRLIFRPAPPARPQQHVVAEPNELSVMRLRVVRIRAIHPPPIQTVQPTFQPSFVTVLRSRKPDRCGLVERDTNEFVTVDCQAYKLPKLGHIVQSPDRVLTLYRKGLLRIDPGTTHPAGVAANAFPKGVTPSAPPAGSSTAPAPGTPAAAGADGVALPELIDHRTDGSEGPVKNQLAVGDCTAFSFSSTLDNAIRRLNATVVTSPMHVWSHYGVPDFSPAFDNNKGKPIADFSFWAYDGPTACRMYQGDKQGFGIDDCASAYNVQVDTIDATISAQIAKADAEGQYKPQALSILYQRANNLPTDAPPDTAALAATIAAGKDIWVGMHFYGGSKGEGKGWFYLNSGNVIGDYPWDPSGGGHAVVLAGYRIVNDALQFLIHNSWGPTPGTTGSWGDNGYAWISEEMVKEMLIFAGTIQVVPTTPPPTPAPPPAPLPNGSCPAGHSKDPVDNQCRQQCSADADCGAGKFCAAVSISLSGTPPQWCFPANPLTDDDCDESELVDSVTGQCAPICPDDTRPANGKCS